MKLDNIGFYTLSEKRAKNVSDHSPIMRAEFIITDECNFKCPYCRGLKKELQGTMGKDKGLEYLSILFNHRLKNVRFSGGEPTLHKHLPDFIMACKSANVERIAISTNGSADLDFYKYLISLGVNDFSISLDSGCCATGEKMTGGVYGSWDKAVNSIKELSKLTYVTVGMVFNNINLSDAVESVKFAQSLNPSDIRIISSAQYNDIIPELAKIPVIQSLPILRYRIHNYENKINIRGLSETDTHKCPLVLDDLAIAGNKHFPCIIYMREKGKEIGGMTPDFRKERVEWYMKHNSFLDKICRNNCLDVCRDYNNRVQTLKVLR